MNCRMLIAATAAVLVAHTAFAEKKCELQQYAQMPVNMSGTRPHINGTINGKPAVFLLDSGAFFSMLQRQSADKFQLRVGPMPMGLRVSGIGGTAETGAAKAGEFSLTGFAGGHVYKDVDFIVSGNILGDDIDGLIGQNVIGGADAEYDLANGVIRLFKAKNCSGRNLAYWAGSNSVAEMDVSERSPLESHIIGSAKINGKRIHIMFDSGAWRSLLDLDAAKRAGLELQDDAVLAGGIARGIGTKTVETWVARFDTLDLGGELIKNAQLRVGDIPAQRADMLLGADFFLSHRIYFASKQNKLYFTYNGGSVFDLRMNRSDKRTQVAAASPASASAGEAEPAKQAAASASATDNKPDLDAAEYRRRGAALAGRQDFAGALVSLDQAVKLDSADPDNFYQRGLVRWQNRQPMLAMQDFDQTLLLKPDHTDALMMRGTMRLRRSRDGNARDDFNAALASAQSNADLLMRISQAYQSVGQFDEAIGFLDTWIASHPKDDRLPSVLNERCWSRAMANHDLEPALEDCNMALKKGPRNSAVLDNRAFVYLRLGQWDKSIADYSAALKLQPKKAWSIYGLGLAQLHKGQKNEGEQSLKAALAIDAKVAESYKRAGLEP